MTPLVLGTDVCDTNESCIGDIVFIFPPPRLPVQVTKRLRLFRSFVLSELQIGTRKTVWYVSDARGKYTPSTQISLCVYAKLPNAHNIFPHARIKFNPGGMISMETKVKIVRGVLYIGTNRRVLSSRDLRWPLALHLGYKASLERGTSSLKDGRWSRG
jgi:hypothetical protein